MLSFPSLPAARTFLARLYAGLMNVRCCFSCSVKWLLADDLLLPRAAAVALCAAFFSADEVWPRFIVDVDAVDVPARQEKSC